MGDLIRRQDAIDVVTAWLRKCSNPLNRSKYNADVPDRSMVLRQREKENRWMT